MVGFTVYYYHQPSHKPSYTSACYLFCPSASSRFISLYQCATVFSVTLSCTSTLPYPSPSAIALRTSTPIITFSLGSVSHYVPLSFSVLSSRCASMRYDYAMLYCAELLISLPGADRPNPASSSPFRPTPESRIPWRRAYRKVPSRWKFGEPFMVRYVT